MNEILLPCNPDAEKAVVGACLIDPEAMQKVTWLQFGDFMDPNLGVVFHAAKKLVEEKTQIDLVTISDRLRKEEWLERIGGELFIGDLIVSTPSALHVEDYAHTVADDSVRRRTIQRAAALVKTAHDRGIPLSKLHEEANQITERMSIERTDTARPTGMKDLMSVTTDVIKHRTEHPGLSGIPTPLTKLNDLTDGLQKGDLVIIAGRPGMGKSSLSLDFCMHQAAKGWRALYLSIEMSKPRIGERLLSRNTGISSLSLRKGDFDSEKWPDIWAKASELSLYPVQWDFSPVQDVASMESAIMSVVLEEGLDIAFMDHLGLLGFYEDELPGRATTKFRPTVNRTTQLGLITRRARQLARLYNFVFVVLVQLSRKCEDRADKRPVLSDIRDSGLIEENADDVIFIYRHSVYDVAANPNLAEINLAKHRNGPIGMTPAVWTPAIGTFRDLASTPEPEPLIGM